MTSQEGAFVRHDYDLIRSGMHIPDKHLTLELLNADIQSLDLAPPLPHPDEDETVCPPSFWSESFEVSSIGQTVEFQFKEFQETVSSRMQVLLGGPYRVRQSTGSPRS